MNAVGRVFSMPFTLCRAIPAAVAGSPRKLLSCRPNTSWDVRRYRRPCADIECLRAFARYPDGAGRGEGGGWSFRGLPRFIPSGRGGGGWVGMKRRRTPRRKEKSRRSIGRLDAQVVLFMRVSGRLYRIVVAPSTAESPVKTIRGGSCHRSQRASHAIGASRRSGERERV